MTPLSGFESAARAVGLTIRGLLYPGPGDGAPEGTGTLLMLGPDEPRFWAIFTTAPEYGDGLPDPLDRWSKRVIGGLAAEWDGSALFPSDGPPYPPFIAWALATGRVWASPVGLLVHDQAGLWLSFRGAVSLPRHLPRPSAIRPCDTCSGQPCIGTCPVRALAPGHDYNVAACQAHVASDAGRDCREHGCLVRRACPVSARMQRPDAQAAFHMTAFLG